MTKYFVFIIQEIIVEAQISDNIRSLVDILSLF